MAARDAPHLEFQNNPKPCARHIANLPHSPVIPTVPTPAHSRRKSLEGQQTNIHPTGAAVVSLIRPSLSMTKSIIPQSPERPSPLHFPPLWPHEIVQNHPLDL
jgi:hypothetical protein